MSRSIRAETRSRTKDDVRKIMHAVDKARTATNAIITHYILSINNLFPGPPLGEALGDHLRHVPPHPEVGPSRAKAPPPAERIRGPADPAAATSGTEGGAVPVLSDAHTYSVRLTIKDN